MPTLFDELFGFGLVTQPSLLDLIGPAPEPQTLPTMTYEQAKARFAEHIDKDGTIFCLNPYICCIDVGEDAIVRLDDFFFADDLLALSILMRGPPGK
jgi:hypothetical protein